MKISDILVENKTQLNEIFLDWGDMMTYARTLKQELGKGLSWDQIKNRAMQARSNRLAVKSFINQWLNQRYQLQSAYADKGVDESYYRAVLQKLVYKELGASPTKTVEDAVDILLKNGDDLNNNESQNAALAIILSAIGSKMATKADKVDVQSMKLASVSYGSKLPNWVKVTAGLKVPVIILMYTIKNNNGDNQPHKFVKFNGRWYDMDKTVVVGTTTEARKTRNQKVRHRQKQQKPVLRRVFTPDNPAHVLLNDDTLVKDFDIIAVLNINSAQLLNQGIWENARQTAIVSTNPPSSWAELTPEEVTQWKVETGHK